MTGLSVTTTHEFRKAHATLRLSIRPAHLRIKYDPPIIAGEHWDVLIAWKRQYTPSFTEAIIKSSDILKQEWEITV